MDNESNGKSASAADILAFTDRRYVKRTNHRFGVTVRGQSWTEKEKSDYEFWLSDMRGGIHRERLMVSKRRMIVMCQVDDDGKGVYAAGDESRLEGVDGMLTSWMFDLFSDHVGFGKDEVEELVKNSDSVHADGSLSS